MLKIQKFFNLKALREHAEKNNKTFLAVIDWRVNKQSRWCPIYGAFKTHQDLLGWHKDKTRFGPSNGVCELTLAEQPVKLAIDYDMPDQPTDIVDFSVIDALVSLVKEHAVTNGVVDEN